MRITPERHNAFNAINTERDYQDARKGNSARDDIEDNRDLGSLIVLIDQYTHRIKSAFSGPHPQGRTNALHEIRKVAALCVLAMERHGAPPRL